MTCAVPMQTNVARRLPDSVEEIAEVIGRDRALEFIGKLPQAGKRKWRVCVYIPKTLPADHKLVAMLGWHDAQRLVRAFSGMILQPSNCRFLEKEHRWRRVREMAGDGISDDEIAGQMGFSPERVREIIAGRRVSGDLATPCRGTRQRRRAQ